MRTIHIRLYAGEEVIRLYATKGRRYYIALIEGHNERYRCVQDNCGTIYGANVGRLAAIGDVEQRIHTLRVVDEINLVPIESTCAVIT